MTGKEPKRRLVGEKVSGEADRNTSGEVDNNQGPELDPTC